MLGIAIYTLYEIQHHVNTSASIYDVRHLFVKLPDPIKQHLRYKLAEGISLDRGRTELLITLLRAESYDFLDGIGRYVVARLEELE